MNSIITTLINLGPCWIVIICIIAAGVSVAIRTQ